jgi:pyruvate/2-oxoglutarate dehydrogenase complex dihydrolipoamide dehydrogenase (E3) component
VTELHRPGGEGPVTLVLDDGSELDADEVLFATGREPNTDDIGLDSVGLTPGAWLDVDDTCQVRGVDGAWLYGVGDVNHRALLTHQGKYQARIAGHAIGARAAGRPLDTSEWGAHVATADAAAVPQVVFSDPEAAAVGWSARDARERGRRVRTVDVDIARAVAGASLYADGYQGRARMVVDLDDERLLGATFVGPDVAELLHSATVAVAAQVPISRLWHAVPSFPTISEVWLRLLEAYRDQSPEDGEA